MLPISFQTPRLQARLPVSSDAAAIFKAYTSKPEVSRYMMWVTHTALAEAEAFITGCIAAVQSGTRFAYVLSEQHNPTVNLNPASKRTHFLGIIELGRRPMGEPTPDQLCTGSN